MIAGAVHEEISAANTRPHPEFKLLWASPRAASLGPSIHASSRFGKGPDQSEFGWLSSHGSIAGKLKKCAAGYYWPRRNHCALERASSVIFLFPFSPHSKPHVGGARADALSPKHCGYYFIEVLLNDSRSQLIGDSNATKWVPFELRMQKL